MPAKKKQIRFRMDTETFILIWRNHTHHPKSDDWKTFVLSCFDRFSEESEEYNISQLYEEDERYPEWKDDMKYQFLSERCYAKCMTIRSKLMKEMDYEPALPDGYKTRGGGAATKRITPGRMRDLFQMKE